MLFLVSTEGGITQGQGGMCGVGGVLLCVNLVLSEEYTAPSHRTHPPHRIIGPIARRNSGSTALADQPLQWISGSIALADHRLCRFIGSTAPMDQRFNRVSGSTASMSQRLSRSGAIAYHRALPPPQGIAWLELPRPRVRAMAKKGTKAGATTLAQHGQADASKRPKASKAKEETETKDRDAAASRVKMASYWNAYKTKIAQPSDHAVVEPPADAPLADSAEPPADAQPADSAEPPADAPLADSASEDQEKQVTSGKAGPALAVFHLTAPDIELRPRCNKCRADVDVLRSSATGKRQGTWRCNECNVKCVQLSRKFGSWPPKSFQALPQDWQSEFYASLRGLSGGADLEKHVIHRLTMKRIDEEESSLGGEFLPLSVYATRGFDTNDIATKSKPIDIEDHAVLGKLTGCTSGLP